MAVAFVRNHTNGISKTSNASVTGTLAANVAVGNLLVFWGTWDNSGTSTPLMNSVNVPGGESASWTRIASHNSSTSGGSGGNRGEMWGIIPTIQWNSATVVTGTLASSVTAKVGLLMEFSGCTLTLRGTAGTGVSTTGVASATTGGTAPSAGDLVLGAASCETAIASTTDTDTTNGSWSTALAGQTAGSTDQTNQSAILQYKIVNAGGHQTYNPVMQVQDSGAAIVALVPAVGAAGWAGWGVSM